MNDKSQRYLKLGYKTPNRYLEDSKQEMLNHVLAPPQEEKVVRPLWRKLGGIAAIAILLLAAKWSLDSFQPFLPNSEFVEYDALLIESISVDEEDFDLWFEEHYVLNVL